MSISTITLIPLVLVAAGCGGGSSLQPSPAPPLGCLPDCGPPPSALVTIAPASDTLGPGGTRQFRATANTSNGAVTWQVEEVGGGAVTSAGLYTAPTNTGTFHVTAVAADHSQSTASIIVAPSGFTTIGAMNAARVSHTATLLDDGRVLLAGGDGLGSAEVFDPAKGSFTLTISNMSQTRQGHNAVLLPSGKVLITGGDDGVKSLASAELFDPVSVTFIPTGNMTTPRSGATATLLPNGKVLIAGGVDGNSALLATAELYDPAAGTFAPTSSSMTSVRWSHTATLLANGKVLLAGGRSNFSPNVHSATAELFDPSTNTFAATGSMTNGRDFHTATLLPSGEVMVAGGNSFFSISSVELYTPTSGTFTGAGSLGTPRHFHTASLLPNGKALLVGGIDEFPGQESPEFSVLWSAELFDPNSDSFLFTGSLGTQRFGHTATLLSNGQILVAGGSDGVGGTTLNTAELYK